MTAPVRIIYPVRTSTWTAVAYYPFWEGSGSVGKDIAGGNPMAAGVAMTWVTGPVWEGITSPGINGPFCTGPAITLPFTIAFWWRPTQTGFATSTQCLAIFSGEEDHGPLLFYDGANLLYAYTQPGTHAQSSISFGDSELNIWHHVVITFPSSNVNEWKVYVNGVDVTDGPTFATSLQPTTSFRLCSNNGASDFMAGDLSDFIVIQGAITPEDAFQLWYRAARARGFYP